MNLTDDHVASLVAAMLAVNFFPLDRAYGLMPAFRERGLLDPARVAAMTQPDLIAAMDAAGYARGGFLPILSFRLYALMEHLGDGRLDALPAAASAGHRATFDAALGAVPGFGPRTIASAWALFTSARA